MPPKSARVVLVEADAQLRATWSRELRARGWDVREARDIHSALDVMIQHQPHAVITATQPSDATGSHFVRTFRSVVEHDVKIVGVGPVPPDDTSSAGFDLICELPLDIDQLHTALATSHDSADDRKPTTEIKRLDS
ncbi:MAG TPA: hypothetical protein VIV11_23785 [Kofleriaceae bacterium]